QVVEILYSLEMNNTNTFEKTEYPFVNEMLEGILQAQAKIDAIISDHLVNWTLKRLSMVDRAIIRLATYELYNTDTPAEIIINEALNLTRMFTDEGDSKAVKFNNRLLDNIKNTLKK
ncbi:MAG: transcription antitermination factor NusB, partial [Candidatus Izemoplasmataceae bacterium]